jgi:hypothetical protein
MKKIAKISVLMVFLAFAGSNSLLAQDADTAYLSTTHVMTAQGFILSNSFTERKTYFQDGAKIMEEQCITDMSYPDGSGGTHISKSTERFTVVDGQMSYFWAEYTEGDSITRMKAEMDGETMYVSGQSHGEKDFAVWDQQNINNIDLFVFAVEHDALNLTKKTQVRKIYDMYSVMLRDNKMSILGEETLDVSGYSFECDIVRFDYGLIKGKLWLSKDPSGNSFLVKEEADSDHYGAFNMDMTDYSTLAPSEKEKPAGEFGF